MNIIEHIKNFVENECKKPTSAYGYEPFLNHFAPTAQYAEKLADELDGDRDVVMLAAWLHDIGSIMHGREDHHITGSRIAEQKLQKLNYPQKKIELIKKCILNHRGSQQNNRESLEEKIVADADTMSTFDNITGIFKAALVYENKTQDEAQKSVREKLQRKYNRLHFEQSKKIITPKFEAAMLLLQ